MLNKISIASDIALWTTLQCISEEGVGEGCGSRRRIESDGRALYTNPVVDIVREIRNFGLVFESPPEKDTMPCNRLLRSLHVVVTSTEV